MYTQQINHEALEADLLDLLDAPLDTFIDALEGALRRRAGETADWDTGTCYHNLALELGELKARDYELSEGVVQ